MSPIQSFYHSDILSADQFTKENLTRIFSVARKMKKLVMTRGASDVLRGKMMTALFYEPSSRTFGSFIASMQRLGGGCIPIQGVAYSSVSKGESLVDTVRTFGSYCDVIVIRHSEVGAAKIAAEFSDIPVINAGDGVGEHPTQALLDIFTIEDRLGSIDGKTVTMVGDLLNGRTIHSLLRLLAIYRNIHVHLVAPDILRLPGELARFLRSSGVRFDEQENLESVIGHTDVLYVTRVQKERFTDLASYEKLKHRYIISAHTASGMKKNSIIMHPFPRVGEIDPDVDLDPREVYIREQMKNGMYVRMALLSLVLQKTV